MILRTGQVNKDFSPRIFISKKMVTNMKLAFRNVHCGSLEGHLFLLFTEDYLSEHSYIHRNLILLIA